MKIDNNSSSWLVPSFPLFIAKDDRKRYNEYKATGTKPTDKYEKDAMEYDEFRTKIINLYGIEVLRFSNSDIDKNFEGVCALIDKTVKEQIGG